jgi:hypothetical protein
MENSEIYNWKTNRWTTELSEDIVIGGAEKVYHVKHVYQGDNASLCPDLMIAMIRGTDCTTTEEFEEEVDEVPPLVSSDTGEEEYSDLTKYVYRQEVMECMYMARGYLNMNASGKRECRSEIGGLFRRMRGYMREQGLLEDAFMVRLCDDMKVVHSTLDSQFGEMFATARHDSQGYQNIFSPSNLSREYTTRQHIARAVNSQEPSLSDYFPMARQGSATSTYDDDDTASMVTVVPMYDRDGLQLDTAGEQELDEDDIENYRQHESSSSSNTSCYTTSGALDTIRQMSQAI